MKKRKPRPKDEPSYSLRQVVELTGLSEFTLRGWEGRYRAFAPERTATGRRKYSSSDLHKAMLLRDLVGQNYRISEIAGCSSGELRKMIEGLSPLPSVPEVTFQLEISYLIKCLTSHDWGRIEKEFFRMRQKETPLKLVLYYFSPLLSQIAQLVDGDLISVSQEHVISAMIKESLFLISHGRKITKKKKFVVAAPEGDHHELGILSAHAILRNKGCKSLYVGPNTPKKDLSETSILFSADVIVLGSTVSRNEGATDDLINYLHFLEKNLPQTISIWLGGRNVTKLSPQLNRHHLVFGSLLDFANAVQDDSSEL